VAKTISQLLILLLLSPSAQQKSYYTAVFFDSKYSYDLKTFQATVTLYFCNLQIGNIRQVSKLVVLNINYGSFTGLSPEVFCYVCRPLETELLVF